MGTIDAKLVALDAEDRQAALGDADRRSREGYSETMAPAVVDGKVLIGTNGGEYGVRGFIKAFDANDGKLLWTFYSIPETGQEGVWDPNDATGRDMHRDIPAEKARSPRTARFYQTLGGGVWMTPAIDKKTRTVFFLAAILRRICTARSARATTCTPTRWSRSISTRARTSGISSTSRTTCGTSTPSARRS
jgi:outer membrane protein assembly factor BamB